MSGIKRTKADKDFSLKVRARDGFICQRCRNKPAPSGLHCAHMFSRRCQKCTKGRIDHVCARLDMSNAMALCYGCHQWVDSHPDEKELLFREKFGDEEFERVAALAHGKRDR